MLIVLSSYCLGETPGSDETSTDLNQRKQAWMAELESRPTGFAVLSNQAAFGSADESLMSMVYDSDALSVHMIFDPKQYHQLLFKFVDNDRPIVSLRGHRYSSFRREGNLLFFAHYLPDDSGCEVAAYDLTDGKEVWRTDLHQKTPQGHSGYQNRVNMILLSGYALPRQNDKGADSTLQILGSESYCDYIEVLDAKTGTSLAIKHYRVGF